MQSTYHYRLFTLCFLSVALGAMDSVFSSAYLPDIVRDLTGLTGDAATGAVGSWVSFAFLAGATLGGILLSFLSDRIGRRAVLTLALLCYGSGSALGALAGSWEMLAVTRVLVGVGVGTALVVSAVIISETWEERTRAVALGILSVAYPVGVIASGIITSNVKDWRTAFVIGGAGMLLALLAHRAVRESAQWSTSKHTSVQLKLGDYRAELLSGVLIYGAMLIGLWATFSWLPTWVQSLLGNDATEGQSQRGFSVTLLGMGGLVGGIASGLLANRFGGKMVQAGCFVVCFLLSYFLFQTNTAYSVQVMIGIALLGTCFGVSQGVLNDYIPELFPAALRSTATGLCFHVGRAFTAAAVFFVGAFVVWFGGYGNAIFSFSMIYIAGLLALVFVKKSKTSVPKQDHLIDSEQL